MRPCAAGVITPEALRAVPPERLPEPVLKLISDLAGLVGSPEYEKTPQFGRTGARKRQWDRPIPLPATKIAKNSGAAGLQDKIRTLVNKVTSRTYSTIVQSLKDLVANEMLPEWEPEVAAAVVKMCSSVPVGNSCLASALLDISPLFPSTHTAIYALQSDLRDDLTKISYISPQTDYDEFCENNKRNSVRRVKMAFLWRIAGLGLIDNDAAFSLARYTQDLLTKTLDETDSEEIVNELAEIVWVHACAIVPMPPDKNRSEFLSAASSIAKMKASQKPSLTNKAVFKHMDIGDLARKA